METLTEALVSCDNPLSTALLHKMEPLKATTARNQDLLDEALQKTRQNEAKQAAQAAAAATATDVSAASREVSSTGLQVCVVGGILFCLVDARIFGVAGRH